MMKMLAACAAIMVFAFGIAHADLIDNGGGLIYDTVRNITWYDLQSNPITYDAAQAWAAGLTVGGESGWRLPSARTSPSLGAFTKANYNVTSSEMGFLFYSELNDKGFFGPDGSPSLPGTYGLVNEGPFKNLTGGNHWTETAYTPRTEDALYFGYAGSDFVGAATGKYAWGFDLSSGAQGVNLKANANSVALAVHDGNIHPLVAAPMPPAFLLFCPCIAALAVMRRKWRRQ